MESLKGIDDGDGDNDVDDDTSCRLTFSRFWKFSRANNETLSVTIGPWNTLTKDVSKVK